MFCDLHSLKESIKCFDLIFLKNSLLKLRLLKCMQNLYLKRRDKQFSWDHRRILHFVTMDPKLGGTQEENGYHHVTDEIRSSHQVCSFVVPMLLHISGEISVEGDSWKQIIEMS